MEKYNRNHKMVNYKNKYMKREVGQKPGKGNTFNLVNEGKSTVEAGKVKTNIAEGKVQLTSYSLALVVMEKMKAMVSHQLSLVMKRKR